MIFHLCFHRHYWNS